MMVVYTKELYINLYSPTHWQNIHIHLHNYVYRNFIL